VIGIRPFDPAHDAVALARLVAEHDLHYGGPEPGLRDVEQRLCALPPGVEILLAVDERQPRRQIVAFASFSILFPTSGAMPLLYLKELYVAAVSRRRGAARMLLQSLARIARERGCTRLEWTTSEENAAARALYDALDAEPVPRKISYRIDGEALDRLAGDRE
jgi:ribosomal protein S18 acetylase RimI-like enzyme